MLLNQVTARHSKHFSGVSFRNSQSPLGTRTLNTDYRSISRYPAVPPARFTTTPRRPLTSSVELKSIASKSDTRLEGEAASKMSGKELLTNDDGPLVWIDCEMTGLNVDTDRLLEIAVIITNGRLEPVDEGIEYIIRTPRDVLDKMDEWCTTTHGNSGLTQSCIDSPHSHEEVTKMVVDYIQKWIPEKGAGLLAGSSVHQDMRFLYKGMPEVIQHLSYRILDVSSVKEICKRWYPSIRKKEQDSRTSEVAHRALDDIQASIRELKFYQEHIFIPLEPVEPQEKKA